MTKQERLNSIDNSLSDYLEYDSIAALESVLYQVALLIAWERGEMGDKEN